MTASVKGLKPQASPVLAELPFELPEFDTVGLSSRVLDVISAATDELRAAPTDPAKAGELGMIFYNAACPLVAVKCFEYVATLEPKSVRWRYYLGWCHDDLYNTAEAVATFESARALDPNYAPILVKLARLRQKTDVTAARELYEKALMLSPRNPQAHFGMGECARVRGDPAAAISHYEKAIELAPQYDEAHQALATCLEAVGKPSEAAVHRSWPKKGLEGISQGVSDDPLLVGLLSRAIAGSQLVNLGEALAESGQVGKAIAALQAAIEKDDSDLTAREELGILLDRTGHSKEAVREFRTILNRRPSDFDTALNLAWALMNTGAYAEAYLLGRDVLGSEPNNARATGICGWALLRGGRPRDSLKHLDRLVELAPNDPESHIALASALVCLLRFEPAIEHYRRAGSQRPAGTDLIHHFVSRLLRVMMEQHRAVAKDRNAKATRPKCFEPLAAAFESQEMIPEAKAARAYNDALLEQVLQSARRGAHEDGIEFVRVALEEQGKRADAEIVVRLKKHVESHPKDFDVQHLWATVLLELGDPAGAKAQWRQLLAGDPHYVTGYLALTIELLRENDFAEARRVLEGGLQQVPDSPLLTNALAWSLATAPDPKLRDAPRAVELAKKASAAAGDKDPGMLDTLAVAHAAMGDFVEAARIEQEAVKTARESGQGDLLKDYRERLKLFKNKKPYVQTTQH